MQVLIFAGLIRAIISTTGPLFYSLGKPRIDTRCQVIRFFVLAISIYPLVTKLGLLGASLAVTASLLFSGIFFAYHALKLTNISPLEFVKELAIPLINTSIFVVFIFWLKSVIFIGLGKLLLIGLGAGSIYFLMAFLADKMYGYNIYFLIKENLSYLKK